MLTCSKTSPLPPPPYSSTAAAKPGLPCEVCPPLAVVPTASMDSSLDFYRLASTMRHLVAGGWYYEGISCQDASQMLNEAPVGTFLVRDSADPRYLFALSVKTKRGPTSIRIHYVNGQFRLDAEACLLNAMPTFDCVVQLVDYYVRMSNTEKCRAHVWLDQTGRRDLPVQLTKPLRRRVSSLQHLCRTTINQHLPAERLSRLQLPTALKNYLREYPYPQ